MNLPRPVSAYTAELLAHARGKLRALTDCLPGDGWLGPRAEHLNPPLWEAGHVIWFQERWCLRARPDGHFEPSLIEGADALYDSSTVPHDTRWSLSLLAPDALDDYASRVAAAVSSRLHDAFSDDFAYFAELCVYHELMHIEAMWMAFQNLGYTPPSLPAQAGHCPAQQERLAFSAGDVTLGSGHDEGFIFDNEKWRHRVAVPAFDLDAYPVSEAVFAGFVDAGGYQQDAGWSEAGRMWRDAYGVSHPLYWHQTHDGWQVRRFAEWTPLAPDAPMLHVNRHEAEACAAWLGRRLPSAGQWLRASGHAHFQWGMGWEWMRDPFAPYPGFTPDPYLDYSQPWFNTHYELRGAGPVTAPLLKRPGFRNFYLPHRRDPFAGFRTVSAP